MSWARCTCRAELRGSGGDCALHGPPGFDWFDLGIHGDLPIHLPMGVNELGQGPEDDSMAHHYECWCGHPGCPLTAALLGAWEAGQRASLGVARPEAFDG